MKEKFIELLKERGIYDAYLEAGDNYGWAGDGGIDTFLDTTHPVAYLTSAFVWDRTTGGHTLWENANDMWLKTYNETLCA